MIISLTGFMGSGKTSVGEALSSMLGWPLIDLDKYIEKTASATIPEIFEKLGERTFRSMELDCLRFLLLGPKGLGFPEETDTEAKGQDLDRTAVTPWKGGNWILSLGGGTLTTPMCAELIQSRTRCIYLRASVETLIDNLSGGTSGRPMLSGSESPKALEERIRRLMAERETVYRATAHHTIKIDGLSPVDVAGQIAAIIRSMYN